MMFRLPLVAMVLYFLKAHVGMSSFCNVVLTIIPGLDHYFALAIISMNELILECLFIPQRIFLQVWF